MKRTTSTDLYNALTRLNAAFGHDLTKVTSSTYKQRRNHQSHLPGSFLLHRAYGGWQLQRILPGGGVHSVTSGYRPRREVVEYIYAMLDGAAMMERHKVEKSQMI
jgi:hypothetical protein